jgi:hypothetical protein
MLLTHVLPDLSTLNAAPAVEATDVARRIALVIRDPFGDEHVDPPRTTGDAVRRRREHARAAAFRASGVGYGTMAQLPLLLGQPMPPKHSRLVD